MANFNVIMEATLEYIGHKDLLQILLLMGLDARKYIQSYLPIKSKLLPTELGVTE